MCRWHFKLRGKDSRHQRFDLIQRRHENLPLNRRAVWSDRSNSTPGRWHLVKPKMSSEELEILPESRNNAVHTTTVQSHSSVYDCTRAAYTHLPPCWRWCFCRAGRCGTKLQGSPAPTSPAGATAALLGGTVGWAPLFSICKRQRKDDARSNGRKKKAAKVNGWTPL